MYACMSVCMCVTDQPMIGESCRLSEDVFITCAVVWWSKLLIGTGASQNGSDLPRQGRRRPAAPQAAWVASLACQ